MPVSDRSRWLSRAAWLAALMAVTGPAQGRHVPGEVVVRFRPGVPGVEAARVLAGEGAREVDAVPRMRLRLVKIPPGRTVAETIERLNRNPNVERAESNSILYPKNLPNDSYLASQWALEQIGAKLAWGMTVAGAEGADTVTIAVVDSGIISTHPDLASKLVAGRCVIDDSANTDPDPGDDHGTFVASIAAAMTGNGIGISGVAARAKLMPIKGGFSDFQEVKGVLWAADNGARVINISLGTCNQACVTCPVECEEPSEFVAEAMRLAYQKGVVIVASAGNESTTQVSYPAGYPYVLGVAATAETGLRASYSNRGAYIDVAAPGGKGLSNCNQSVDPMGASDSTNRCIAFGFSPNDFRTGAGTSVSAPHVAGLAAVLFGQNPARTNDDVVGLIRSTAHQPAGATGWNDDYGFGRIDMNAALTAGSPVPFAALSASIAVSPASPATGNGLTVTLDVSNTGAGDAVEVVPDMAFTSGEDLVTPVNGPASATIKAGEATAFVWTFSAAGSGIVDLTALARGTDRRTGAIVRASAELDFQIITVGFQPVPDRVFFGIAPGKVIAAPNVLDLSDPASRVAIVMRGTKPGATADLAIYDAVGGLVRKSGVILDSAGWGTAYVTAGDNLAPGVYWALVTGAGVDDRKPFKIIAGRKPI